MPKPEKLIIWQGNDANGECKDCDEPAFAHAPGCPYWAHCEATARDYAAKLQFLVDWADGHGMLGEHVFTFPDGDVWEAKRAAARPRGEAQR